MSLFKGWPTLTEIFFGKEKAKEMSEVAYKVEPKAKATPKGMYNHRIDCRHRSRGDHTMAVVHTGNIGTTKEPYEATFKCIKKVPISDNV